MKKQLALLICLVLTASCAPTLNPHTAALMAADYRVTGPKCPPITDSIRRANMRAFFGDTTK